MTQRKAILTLGVSAALAVGGLVAAPLASASEAKAAAACSDVELVFARGTGDVPVPLGSIGRQLGPALTRALPGKTVLATGVVYDALADQSSAGPGATWMTRHIVETAAACADTQFVIGGYSQGASVTDIAVAATGSQWLGTGETIPAALAPRVKAVLVFGNPLSSFGTPLETASAVYGPKTKSVCGRSDGFCGGSRWGNVDGDHLSYISNTAVIAEATQFAVDRIS